MKCKNCKASDEEVTLVTIGKDECCSRCIREKTKLPIGINATKVG